MFVDPHDGRGTDEFLSGLTVDFLLVTHEHYDHISGVNGFKERYGVSLYANQKCDENMRKPTKNYSKYFEAYMKRAVDETASDLFVVAGQTVSMKKEGEIVPIDSERLMPDASEKLVRELYGMARRPIDRYLSVGDDDFSLSVKGLARFRVNTYRQRGSMAAVIRVVSFGIPDWQEKDIPEEVMKIANMTRGMVLVTGPAGGGNPPRWPAW